MIILKRKWFSSSIPEKNTNVFEGHLTSCLPPTHFDIHTNKDFQNGHFACRFSDCPFRKTTILYLCIFDLDEDILNLYCEETKLI